MQITLKQAKEIIPDYLEAGISVELQSSPGLGKSDFAEQLIAHLSKRDGEQWGHSEMFLATQTPPDLLGYMMPETRNIGGEDYRVSSWTMPAWMMTKDGKPVSHYRKGILVLDEYGQGEGDVKRASAQLILKRELGPWKLPKQWGALALTNDASHRSGVTKSFDFVINRRAQFELTADLNSWEEWANEAGVSPVTIMFARSHPEIVFSGAVPEKQGPWCTPRSLCMFDKILQIATAGGNKIPTDALMQARAASLIGTPAMQALFVWIKLENEMPSFERIVADPEHVPVPDKPDAQMLVCYHLAAKVDEPTVNPVITYLNRFPKEFAVTFVKAATKRNYKLIVSAPFQKWCSENSSLMAALRS